MDRTMVGKEKEADMDFCTGYAAGRKTRDIAR